MMIQCCLRKVIRDFIKVRNVKRNCSSKGNSGRDELDPARLSLCGGFLPSKAELFVDVVCPGPIRGFVGV